MATRKAAIPPEQIGRMREAVTTGQQAAEFINNQAVTFYMDKLRDKLIKRWVALALDDTVNKDAMHQMVKALDMLRAEAAHDERRGRDAAQALQDQG